MVVSSGPFRLFGPRPLTLIGLAVACALAQSARAQSAEPSSKDDDQEVHETVIVTGSQVQLSQDYAGDQVARGGRIGLFGNMDMMDVPFDSTNYTAEFIRDMQAESVADVVQSDPAVRVARGYGNFQELYNVRGFPVYSDDMSYDGLYGLLPRQFVAAEFLERVEVFRGANTFLNGAAPGGSGVGGEFNLVPKRAEDEDLNRLSAGYENSSQGYAAADLSRRFGDSREWGLRLNVAHHEGDDSVDHEDLKLSMASLGADFHGDHVKFAVDLGWQNHDIDEPRPSVYVSEGGVPAAPKASSNYAQPWTFSEEHDVFGVFRGEYDFSKDDMVWVATGFRHGDEHNVLANPTADADGVTSAYRYDNTRRDLITTSEIGGRLSFETGFIKHKISASASVFDLDSKNAYAFSNFAGFTSSLYNPVTVAEPVADYYVGGDLSNPLTTQRTKTSSGALADVMSFADDRVILIGGVREQNITQYGYDYNTGLEDSSENKSALTPAVGLVIKPVSYLSVYANYIEALLPGAVAPATSGSTVVSNAGHVFSPTKSKQEEVGVKLDAGSIGATLSLFRITEPQTELVGDVYTEDGQQRNQGIEVSTYGEITKGLRLLGGATYLDAQYTTQTTGGGDPGKKIIGIPDITLNMGLEYDIPQIRGVTVDGRIIYTASEWADSANTESIPSWTRLDLGARYAFMAADKPLSLCFNVENVTDKSYWSSAGGYPGYGYLVMGAPRTVMVSLSADL